jgi:hypothetical protein
MHVLSRLIRLGVSSLFRLEVSSLFRMDVSMLFSRPHFWVNNSLKKVHMSRLYCIHYTAVLTSNFPPFFRAKGIFREKTSIPVDIFEIPVLYRYYTGPGIEKSIPNWKH